MYLTVVHVCMCACLYVCICVCVCVCDGVCLVALQWSKQGSPRKDTEGNSIGYPCGQPCISDDYLYCGFEGYAYLKKPHLALYRIKLHKGRICDNAWQRIALPAGDWQPDMYVFNCSGHLYSFLCSQQPGSTYRVYRRSRSVNWTHVISLPYSLFNFGIATLDSKLLVVGGSSDLRGTLYSQKVFSLDLSSQDPSWTRLANLPHGCCTPQVILQGSQVHVLGYHHSDSDDDCRVLTLDLSIADGNQCWLHDIIPPVPQLGCYGAFINGCLVVIANVGIKQQQLYMYVPECRQFLLLLSDEISRRVWPCCCLSHGNTLCVLNRNSYWSQRLLLWKSPLEIEVLSTDASDPVWVGKVGQYNVLFVFCICYALVLLLLRGLVHIEHRLQALSHEYFS